MVSKTPGCSGTGKPYPWGQEGDRQGYMRLGAALLSQSLKAPSNGLSLMSSQLDDGLRAPSPSTSRPSPHHCKAEVLLRGPAGAEASLGSHVFLRALA